MKNFSKNIALWLIIGLLLIALFNLFQGTSKDQTGYSISFSDFLTAVDSGNVSEVNIKGNNVEGFFEDFSIDDKSNIIISKRNNIF